MLVCVHNAHFSTRDRGCSRHPAFPAPSYQERDNELHHSGETRRENEPVCFHVIASEAKQSISPHEDRWIASSLSLLAMTVASCLKFKSVGAAMRPRCAAFHSSARSRSIWPFGRSEPAAAAH